MNTLPSFIRNIDVQNIAIISLRVFLIFAAALLISYFIKRLLVSINDRLNIRSRILGEASGESSKRIHTIMRLIKRALAFLLWTPVILVILNQMGIKIGPILAGAGILGIAISFGSQSLVKDYISGFFIILENQIRIGDIVTINSTMGIVEQINFRTIVLRDIKGSVHIFQNGDVTTLSNHTNDWSGYIFDIGVSYKENIDKVINVMKSTGNNLRDDEVFGENIIEDIEIFGVDRFDDSAVIIKGRIKTKPGKQFETGREFLKRIKQAFDDKNIEIPFPHRTIFYGNQPDV